MLVYAVYRLERDGSETLLSAWPDVWNARHWILRGEEETKLPHFIVERKLVESRGPFDKPADILMEVASGKK